MADDQTFRLILALGMAAFLPVAIYHRVRSQASRETLDRRQEGLFSFSRSARSAWRRWAASWLSSSTRRGWRGRRCPYRSPCAGRGWRSGCRRWRWESGRSAASGRNITDTVVTRREHTLVTGGPYRFVRHPFYVTTALALVANALTTANWFIAVTGAAALALM